MPIPAIAGSNVPLTPDVIPVPVQVPPTVPALRLNADEPKQTGAEVFMVASANSVTVMVTVAVDAGQGVLAMLH